MVKCDFCHRIATTKISNIDNTEQFNVCDFCEEELIQEEIRQHSQNQREIQKYLYKIHRGSISIQL